MVCPQELQREYESVFNSKSTLRKERASVSAHRKGLCARCGIKTHKVFLLKRIPLTNNDAYQGICIRCNPASVPAKFRYDYEQRNGSAMVLQVKGSALKEVNGMYHKDLEFKGPYKRFAKKGFLKGTPVSFVMHRNRTRWFLSAQPTTSKATKKKEAHSNAVYLYSASAEDHLIAPPTEEGAWTPIQTPTKDRKGVWGEVVTTGCLTLTAVVLPKEATVPPSSPTTASPKTNANKSHPLPIRLPTGGPRLAMKRDEILPLASSVRSLSSIPPIPNRAPKKNELKIQTIAPSRQKIVFFIPQDNNKADTVFQLKEKIHKEKGIPIAQQVLMLTTPNLPEKRQLLENDKCLQDYHVQRNSLVELCFPQGGMGDLCREIIVCWQGNTHTLQVDPSYSIQAVKSKIKRSPWFHVSFSHHDLTLKLQGKPLEDNLLLKEASVRHQATLRLEVAVQAKKGTAAQAAPPLVQNICFEHQTEEEQGGADVEDDDAASPTNEPRHEELVDFPIFRDQGTPVQELDLPEEQSSQAEEEDYAVEIPKEQVEVVQPTENPEEVDTMQSSHQPLDIHKKVCQMSSFGRAVLQEEARKLDAAWAAPYITIAESDLFSGDEKEIDIPVAIAFTTVEEEDANNKGSSLAPQGNILAGPIDAPTCHREPELCHRGPTTEVETSGESINQVQAQRQQQQWPQPAHALETTTETSAAATDTSPTPEGCVILGQRSPQNLPEGTVSLGGESGTVQKWAAVLDQLKDQMDPNRNFAQYTPLPVQYAQNPGARAYHQAFEDAFFAAVSVMQMQSQGLGLPGPTILARLVRAPCQAAGFLVSTVGEMIATLLDWHQERSCVNKANKFLGALPASSGKNLDRFVTKLSALMVHAQMQRAHDPEVEDALARLEGMATTHQQSMSIPDRIMKAVNGWQKAAKRKARSVGYVGNNASAAENPEAAAAIVHVGLVICALVNNSSDLTESKEDKSPEDLVDKLVAIMDIPSPPLRDRVPCHPTDEPLPLTADMESPTRQMPSASSTTLDLSKIQKVIEEMEVMKQRVESIEEQHMQKQHPDDCVAHSRVRRSVNHMQVLEVGVGQAYMEYQIGNAVAQRPSNPDRLYGHSQDCDDAQRSELTAEHSTRLMALETNLAETQEQLEAVLELVAPPKRQRRKRKAKHKNNQTPKIHHARKILQGNIRETSDDGLGYWLEEGTFEAATQDEEDEIVVDTAST